MVKKLLVTGGILACFFLMVSQNAQSVYGQTDEGEAIFSEYCSKCHTGGFTGWITGAPKKGDADAWAPYIKNGVDVMTASAIKGIGNMDPKGGCEKCSEEQIRKVVEYIVSQSKK